MASNQTSTVDLSACYLLSHWGIRNCVTKITVKDNGMVRNPLVHPDIIVKK
jgi:hypothetical protein